MSEPKHYWASGMPRKEAQSYLNDLCGDTSCNYTETESEVTCDRCLAVLRGEPSVVADPNGVLDRSVRAAVLKEREEILLVARAMHALDSNPDYRSACRHLIDEIKRRP
jgi:hypothetical protein